MSSWLAQIEWGRKALHAASAFLALWILCVDPPVSTISLAVLTLYIVTVDIARISLRGWATWFNRAFPFVFRNDEHRRLSGASVMMIGIALTAVLFNARIAAAGILCLAFGDSAAAIVGQSAHYFRNRDDASRSGASAVKLRRKKTVYGSVACLLVSALVTALLVGFDPAVYLPAGVVAAVMERWTPGRWDNLSIPLVTAAVVDLLI